VDPIIGIRGIKHAKVTKEMAPKLKRSDRAQRKPPIEPATFRKNG